MFGTRRLKYPEVPSAYPSVIECNLAPASTDRTCAHDGPSDEAAAKIIGVKLK